MSQTRFYQRDISSWLLDTQYMHPIARAGYSDLLDMHYYEFPQGLPDNDEKLCRLARLDRRQWNKHKDDIRSKFVWENGYGTNPRAQKELAKIADRSEKAKKSINSRWEKRRREDEHAEQEKTNKISLSVHTNVSKTNDVVKLDDHRPKPVETPPPRLEIPPRESPGKVGVNTKVTSNETNFETFVCQKNEENQQPDLYERIYDRNTNYELRTRKEITSTVVDPNVVVNNNCSGKPKPVEQVRPDTPARRIFIAWQKIMNKPCALFSDKRRKKIIARLKNGYSEQYCIEAIHGCSLNPYNMGDNTNNVEYNDLELIMRDPEHIERYHGFFENPPQSKTRHQQREAEINDLIARVCGVSHEAEHTGKTFEGVVL